MAFFKFSKKSRTQGSPYDALSYSSIIQDRKKFQQSGGVNSSDFNNYDFPDLSFFRILFHFQNGDDEGNLGSHDSGLLAPTWLDFDSGPDDEQAWGIQSAWSYLMLNGETERAENLRAFCELLSNINSESPWYFQSVSGLGDILSRNVLERDKDQKFDDEEKVLTIKCLPDAYDNRVGTLLDLYRSVVWSWTKRCEVLPSNLRKFDMTIITYSVPITGIHTPLKEPKITDALGKVSDFLGLSKADGSYGTVNRDRPGSEYLTSFKSIELIDCELDYNSGTSAWNELSNTEGSNQEFEIKIRVGDAYESRYNEFMRREITDLIALDMEVSTASGYNEPQDAGKYLNFSGLDSDKLGDDITDRKTTSVEGDMLDSLTNQAIAWGTSTLSTKVNKIVLGNLFGFSLSNIGSQLDRLNQGNLASTVKTVKSYVNGNYNGYGGDPSSKNIFSDTAPNDNYDNKELNQNRKNIFTRNSDVRAQSIAQSV